MTAEPERLFIAFTGRLSADESRKAINAVCDCLDETPRHVVWDLTDMTGYDPLARVVWQSELVPRRKRLLSLSVQGGSAFVRMGAVAIAFALGIPLEK